MRWNRRGVLKAGSALAGVSAAGMWAGPARGAAAGESTEPSAARSRHITLLNLHTGERLETEFIREGVYLPAALFALEVLLRDFRTGEQHAVDPDLMTYLVDAAHAAGGDPVFSVISGYRSPQTNALLRERSTGVAQHSLHMVGRAIDVRMSGVDCADLAAHAVGLKRGGVGYYRASDFVHLDTGAFRTWRG